MRRTDIPRDTVEIYLRAAEESLAALASDDMPATRIQRAALAAVISTLRAILEAS